MGFLVWSLKKSVKISIEYCIQNTEKLSLILFNLFYKAKSQLVEMYIIGYSCHVFLMIFSCQQTTYPSFVLFKIVVWKYFQLSLMAKGHNVGPFLSSHMAMGLPSASPDFPFPGKTWTHMGSLCLIWVHHKERYNLCLRSSLETTFYNYSEGRSPPFYIPPSSSSFYTPAFF